MRGQHKGTYPCTRLSDRGKRITKDIHFMVALMWVPNDNRIMNTEVNHKDHNKLNYRADNLEWVTHSENVMKRYFFHAHKGIPGAVD